MDSDLPVTHVADIQRWGTTNDLEGSRSPPDEVECEKRSPFTFNPSINSKIAYWTGDISTLDAHAVVACNNETFTDVDTQTSALFERAGPELRREVVQSVKVCRTGDVKLTQAFQLPSRYVIHTVGPRFNAKYRTAAENALYSCYRNVMMLMREHQLTSIGLRCIHSTRRGYPSADGAHLGLRTVRRFLEKYGNEINLVIFVVTGSDRETYTSIMPLYFPRSLQEESFAASQLPVDIGNADGEPVIAERQIRIAANPGLHPSDNVNGDDSEESDGPDLSELLGTSQSIGEHAFSKMEADVDKNRHNKRNSVLSADVSEMKRLRYQQILRQARRENLSDIAALRFIYQSGFSKTGETVVVYVARNLPSSPQLAEKSLMYAVSQMDAVVNKPYVVVYVHSQVDSGNDLSTSCFKQLYEVADYRYSANLQALYMLHTTFISKMSFWWWSTMGASVIKSKMQYVAGLEYLYAIIAQDQLDLPPFVIQYDSDTYGTRYYNSAEADL